MKFMYKARTNETNFDVLGTHASPADTLCVYSAAPGGSRVPVSEATVLSWLAKLHLQMELTGTRLVYMYFIYIFMHYIYS